MASILHIRIINKLKTRNRTLVYRWLSATIPSVNYHAALAARLENTGTWFISGARFKEWKSEPDIFLWVHGTRKHASLLRREGHISLKYARMYVQRDAARLY